MPVSRSTTCSGHSGPLIGLHGLDSSDHPQRVGKFVVTFERPPRG